MPPIMASVNPRPCNSVRGFVPHKRLIARSTTLKTQEPAQSITTMQVMMTVGPTFSNERIVARKNSREPG